MEVKPACGRAVTLLKQGEVFVLMKGSLIVEVSKQMTAPARWLQKFGDSCWLEWQNGIGSIINDVGRVVGEIHKVPTD